MNAKRSNIQRIVILGVMTVLAVIADDFFGKSSAEIVANFEYAALRALSAASIYLGSVMFLPKLFGWRPINMAYIAMGFIIMMYITLRVWVEKFVVIG